MSDTHRKAEARYEELRTIALQTVESSFSADERGVLKARTITPEALAASRLWAQSSARRVDWDWIDGYSAFRFRHPKRFGMALWQNRQLISLSLGRPTHAGSALRLDFVEASPRELGERPSVIPFILVALGVYGRLIGASQIRIMNPINETVKDYYASFGYTYVARNDYLYRDLL